jgi:acyl-CoA thioester hydrolase
MTRIKLSLPEKFSYSTTIPVRITDLNYAGHVGNDSFLSIIHEIRAGFLRHLGYSELDFAGTGLIMTHVLIEFKKELHYGDIIEADAAILNITGTGFDIIYHMYVNINDQQTRTAAIARTTMTCYDFKRKKVTAIPETARSLLI